MCAYLLLQYTVIYVQFLTHCTLQWRNYYGLGVGEPGGPQPQWAKWGPQAQAVDQTHWPGPLIRYNVIF
jgi:hypothetical protein